MDGYNKFMEYFDIKQDRLFKWGIENTIFPNVESIDKAWEDLLDRIYNNQKVYIRGYGRNGHGTEIYKNFYSFLLGNNQVIQDPTNNTKPKMIIENLTGLRRNKNIFNYQTAHIFGRTKNIFLFEAPWNICYIPKIMDPFTGHEAKGVYISEFQKMFKKNAYARHRKYIQEYNFIVQELKIAEKIIEYSEQLKKSMDKKRVEQFIADSSKEFALISVE